MTTSVITVTINAYPNGIDNTVNHTRRFGSLAIATGDYPATGVPLSFTTLDPPVGTSPIDVYMHSCTTGYVYKYDPVNKSIRIFQSAGTAAPMVEISTTTPSGVYGDTIYFEAIFNRN